MKTQISRDSFDDSKRYSGVYLQQGRMVVDADVNELGDITKRRLEAALADAVASGAPRTGALSIAKSGSNLVMNPGRLYVDGIPARLDASAPVLLTAQPEYRNAPALPANNLRVYADVWERPVSAYEDAGLQDPGLHGADTATRTKTMLQVKWCAAGTDPMDPSVNPRIGDARLTLKLRSISTGSDPCDPCAAEVSVDERIGNYLFRVEVHDVFTTGANTHVVLKWSRDNGAEVYPHDAWPAGFDQGDWVWEYFDGDSENLLGHHYPAGQARRRGVLQETFARPAAPAPNAFVRQWDGYAEFDLTTGVLVAGRGRDRGAPLSTALAATAHAFTRVDAPAGSLLVNLELLELQFGYKSGSSLRRFVAGDYWQVAVREAVDRSGDTVLAGAAPRGVLHHYLPLADIDNSGNVVAFSDARRRQMAFPPLTDIRAADVGFTDHCAGLYSGAQNVQAALDALCGLGAEDIGYTVPSCGTTAAPSVASLMTANVAGFPDLDGAPKSPSVKDILDALMCHLNAARLPFDPTALSARWNDINEGPTAPLTVQQAIDQLASNLDARDIAMDLPATCAGSGGSRTVRELMAVATGATTVATLLGKLFCELRATHVPLDRSTIQCAEIATDPAVVSVQDAIDKLCQGAGQACEITVPVGQLADILRNFATSTLQDISLCLLPGEHVIEGDLAISGKRSVRIKGATDRAVFVDLRGDTYAIVADGISLEGVSFALRNEVGQLRLNAVRISSSRCSYRRAVTNPNLRPMLLVESRVGGSALDLRDNVLVDTWRRPIRPGAFAGEAVGNARVAGALERLTTQPEIFGNPVLLQEVVGQLADALMEMPAAERQRWAGAIGAESGRPTPAAPVVPAAAPATAPARTFRSATAAMAGRLFVGDALAMNETGSLSVLVDTSGATAAASTVRFTDAIRVDAPVRGDIVTAIGDDLITFLFESGVNIALGIASHRFTGVLQGNLVNGEVVLMNELALTGDDSGLDAARDITSLRKDIPPVGLQGGVLTLEGNRIDRLWSLVRRPATGTPLTGPLNGFATCTLSGNDLISSHHSVVAAKLAVHANHFEYTPGTTALTPLARLIANQATVLGNICGINDSMPPVQVGAPNFRANSNFPVVAQF